MKIQEEISLIIPLKGSLSHFNKLLASLPSWILQPNEIIIVESATVPHNLNKKFIDFCSLNNISIMHIHQPNLFPGHARNIGIANATNEIIAFLDVLTLPCHNWLKINYQLLTEDDVDGVWGNTVYLASSITEQIIRASTFGAKPVKTLPGSVFKKNIFKKTGLFIESVRAGEDGDLFSRIAIHNVKMIHSNANLDYSGLQGISYFEIIKKWNRNYIISAKLPHFKAHKDLYFYALSGFLILIAFNWNQIFSYDQSMRGWNTDSVLYIPNVTKISIASIVLAYAFFRGLILPLQKGVSYSFLLPINFIKIAIFSACLDLTKTLSFIKSRITKESDK